jgi:hypothetical protein
MSAIYDDDLSVFFDRSCITGNPELWSFSPNTSLRLRSSKVDMLLDIVFSIFRS